VGIVLVPISVGGWGLRELAVVSLLGAHGLAPEPALLFSVCFGLVCVLGALPGAVVWLVSASGEGISPACLKELSSTNFAHTAIRRAR
jgi:glycosyltransferase 2 family protein